MNRHATALLLLPIFAVPLAAQTAGGGFDKRFSWYGIHSGDIMGAACANVGDVDGDGYDDVAAGAPGLDGPGGNNTPNYGRLQVFSGVDGGLIYEYMGSSDWENVGGAITGLGDVNGDGRDDFAYSSDLGDGTVYIKSGASGGNLLSISAPANSGSFGDSIENAGDYNGDGINDLFVSAPNSNLSGVSNSGSAFVISGATGSVLLTLNGLEVNGNFGQDIACPGDVNGDGTIDFSITATGDSLAGMTRPGAAYLFSGATGTPIYSWPGDSDYNLYGWSIGNAGDINSDGVADIMVGHIFYDSPQNNRVGRVDFYSGADGSLLRQIAGSEYWEDLGSDVSLIGDMDNDGVNDHLLGADGRAYGGRAYIHSGASGDLLYACESDGYSHYFGTTVCGVGDLNQNGRDEFMVGATSAWLNGPTPGAAYLYEFRDFLSANTNTLSAASGGVIELDMNFPDDWLFHPGSTRYAVLATASGLGYSQVFGLPNPLVQDSIFARTAGDNYTPHFQNPRGNLDLNGDAVSTIIFGPGQASSMIGQTFHLSCAWYEIASWGDFMFHAFSRPVAVTIIP